MATTTLFRRGTGSALALCAALSLATATLAAPRRVALPAGTVVPVKLEQGLNSKTSVPGDRFVAALRYGRDDAGLPYGTRFEGVVREAIRSRDGKPGVMDLDFRRAVLPKGQAVTLDASLTDLKNVKRTSSGRLVANADKNQDRLKFIGIGAGAGLLIATLTKGNAFEDILLGAGAGYLYNELRKDKAGDVNLKPGSEFGIRLDRQLAFNLDSRYWLASTRDRYNDSYDRADPYNDPNYDRTDRYNDPYYDRTDRSDRYYNGGYDNGDTRYYDARDARLHRSDYVTGDGRDIGLLLNDRNIRFGSARPFVREGVVYLPIADVARAASIDYRYDSGARMIRLRGDRVRLALDSRIAMNNGERVRLAGPAMLRDGVLYVPMQFLGLVAGGSVYFDQPSRTVVLTTDRDY